MSKTAISTEYQTIVGKNKHTKAATAYYVTAQQRKFIIKTMNPICYIVFAYYLEKAHMPGFDYADDKIAESLGFSIRQVQRARQSLVQYGFFLQSTYFNPKGKKVVITFLGQEAVNDYKQDTAITITKCNEIEL